MVPRPLRRLPGSPTGTFGARLRQSFDGEYAPQLEGQWSGNLEYDVVTLIPVEDEAAFF